MAPGTLTLPQAAAPTPTAEGQAIWDIDDDRLTVGDGVGTQTLGPGQRATQAQVEAETAGAVYVPPDLLKNSPGVAKGWCQIAALGTLSSPSYNVASVTDTAAGDRTIVWGTDFSTAVYSCMGAIGQDAGADHIATYGVFAVGSVQHLTRQNGALTDLLSCSAAFGDQ